jgi:hypothetical protein
MIEIGVEAHYLAVGYRRNSGAVRRTERAIAAYGGGVLPEVIHSAFKHMSKACEVSTMDAEETTRLANRIESVGQFS